MECALIVAVIASSSSVVAGMAGWVAVACAYSPSRREG